EESRAAAAQVAEVLELFRSVCAREEEELGRIDAIAGDGDHGQGMAYGSKGAAAAAQEALEAGAGARTLLVRAGEAWSESAGGTSGALWGAALTAAGGVFDDQAGVGSRTVVDAVEAGIDAIQRLGGAKVGDKTMVDAAAPFRETLEKAFSGDNAAEAILEAAGVAREAADATAEITATLGRARVLGEKSVGTPAPGAISFSILMKELGQHLSCPTTSRFEGGPHGSAHHHRFRQCRLRTQVRAQGAAGERPPRRAGHRRGRDRPRGRHLLPERRRRGGGEDRRRRGGSCAADLWHRSGCGDRGEQGLRHPCRDRARSLLGAALGAVEQRPGAVHGRARDRARARSGAGEGVAGPRVRPRVQLRGEGRRDLR